MASKRSVRLGLAVAVALPLATGCGLIDSIQNTINTLQRSIEEVAEAASREISSANTAINQAIGSAQTSINFATQGGGFSPSQGGFGDQAGGGDDENRKSSVFRSQFKAARMDKLLAMQQDDPAQDYCTGEEMTEQFDCPNGGSQRWSFTCSRSGGVETYVYSSTSDNCVYEYSTGDGGGDGYCGDGYCDNNGDYGDPENLDTCSADCASARNFICGDGQEIPSSWQNDGYCDCRGGEDEDPGTCDDAAPAFCGDGTRVEQWMFNDGYCNCPDGTDEAPGFCDDQGGSGQFVCNSGQSIPSEWEGDGYCDCADGSDEAEGTCGGGGGGDTPTVTGVSEPLAYPSAYQVIYGTLLAPPIQDCGLDADYVYLYEHNSGDSWYIHRSAQASDWTDNLGPSYDAHAESWGHEAIGFYLPGRDGASYEAQVYVCWNYVGSVYFDAYYPAKADLGTLQGGGGSYRYTVNGTMRSRVAYDTSGGDIGGFGFGEFSFESSMTEKAETDGRIEFLNETEDFVITSTDAGDGRATMTMNGRMAYQDAHVAFDFTYEDFVFAMLGAELDSGMSIDGGVTMTGGRVDGDLCVDHTRFDFVTIDALVPSARDAGCNDEGTLEITVNAGRDDEAVGTYRFRGNNVSITSGDATVEPSDDNTVDKTCAELAAEAEAACGSLGGGGSGSAAPAPR